jgi:hypothetical protein
MPTLSTWKVPAMADARTNLYQAAFRLVYAHDDHVGRVILTFLNIWWMITGFIPSVFSAGVGTVMYAPVTISIGIATIVVGFLLMLFRENVLCINLTYLLTLLMLFNRVVGGVTTVPIDADTGAFAALALFAVLGYLRYTIKRDAGFGLLIQRAKIDMDETYKLTK